MRGNGPFHALLCREGHPARSLQKRFVHINHSTVFARLFLRFRIHLRAFNSAVTCSGAIPELTQVTNRWYNKSLSRIIASRSFATAATTASTASSPSFWAIFFPFLTVAPYGRSGSQSATSDRPVQLSIRNLCENRS